MKIIKNIALGLFVLFILYFIVSILLPTSYSVSRSRTIHVSKERIFNEINSLQNWEHWSPWLAKDSTIVNSYSGANTGEGNAMTWTSKESEEGSMTIIGSYPNDSILLNLEFKDFEMTSITRFILEDVEDGKSVKVTWMNSGNLRFYSRIFGLMFDGMMGSDFESGLMRMDAYLHSLSSKMNVELISVPSQYYFSVKATCTPDEIGKTLGSLYGEIGIQMNIQGLKMAGAPFAIYHSIDAEKVELEAGIPTAVLGTSNDRVFANERKAGKAVRADYYGAYEGIQEASEEIKIWMNSKKLKANGAAWESYETDPGIEKDPAKVLTQIYYPIE